METTLRTALTGPTRNAKTIDKIISNLRTIQYQMGLGTSLQTLDFLHDYDKVRKAMAAYTLRSYKTYVGSAAVALESVGSEVAKVYKEKLKELRATIDAEDNSNVPTAKQEAKMVDFQELVTARHIMKEKVDKMKAPTKKEYQDVQSYMLLSLATMCDAILRNQEFCKMVVIQEWNDTMPKDRNYYLPKYSLMYIYEYKTAKVYGRQTILLTDELNIILRNCLALRPYPTESEYLFMINEKGGKLNTLQKLYDRAGLPGISPTIIRNIVATYRSGPHLQQVKQVIQNSKDFGHSVSQHLRYIRQKKSE